MGKHIAVAPASDLFPGISGSGTGVVFYTSAHFPQKYQNRYLIADWTNNCIFLYHPKWDGALQVPAEEKRKIADGGKTRAGDLGYKGEEGRALFRPTDIEVGPDGALYIAGWGSVYGTSYVPKEKWTPEENAKYQGRVFRLRHEAPLIPRANWDTAKRRKPIEKWSFDELMEDIGHQVHVWRVHAQDELVRRGNSVRGDLVKSIESGKLTEIETTWATWALGHIEKVTGRDHHIFKKFAQDGATLNLRIQATRIFGENLYEEAKEILVQLLEDQEPRVRTAALQSLERIGWGDLSNSILSAISDETDRIAFYTAWQCLRRQMPEDARRKLLDDGRGRIRLMAALGLLEEGDRKLQGQFDAFVRDADKDQRSESGPSISAKLRISAQEPNFRNATDVTFHASTTASTSYKIRYTLDGKIPTANSPEARNILRVTQGGTLKAAAFIDGKSASPVTSLHLHKISDSEWKDRLFVRGIQVKGSDAAIHAVDEGLQRGVAPYSNDPRDTLAQVPEAITGATVVPTRKDDEKRKEADYLKFTTNLPATVHVAYDAKANPPKWLKEEFSKTPHTVTTSKGHKLQVYSKDFLDERITLGGNSGAKAMYQVYVSKTQPGKTTTAAAKAALPQADTKHGEEIFFGRGTCFACHQVQGRGIIIGPDLQGIHKRRDINYVIQSTVEPDAYIVEGYQQTSLTMKDGRHLFGMVQEETALQLKLALLTGQQLDINPKDILKREDAKHSGMPSSFAYTLSPQDIADVSAWIMTLPPAKK